MRIKVTVYMKSGNHFTVKCRKFTMTNLSGDHSNRKLSWEGLYGSLSLDVEQVEAVIFKRVLF